MDNFIKKVYQIDGEDMNHLIQDGGAIKKARKSDPQVSLTPSKDLIHKVIRIALRLALKGSYNQDNNIIFQKKPLEGTDIVDLIYCCMSEGETCEGLSEFLQVLKASGLASSDFTNKKIIKRFKGISKLKQLKKTSISSPIVLSNVRVQPPLFIPRNDLHTFDKEKAVNDSQILLELEGTPKVTQKIKRPRKKYTPVNNNYNLRDGKEKRWARLSKD